MKKYRAYKASPIVSVEPVEDAVLQIDVDIELNRPVPTLEAAFEIYQKEAKAIADLLHNSLPQGTFYRLAHELLGMLAAKEGYKGLTK